MTPLRVRMIEDMQIRNLAVNTQETYILQVSLFARHFQKSPELSGPEEIRAYQVNLTNEKKPLGKVDLNCHRRSSFPLSSHPQERMVLCRHHPNSHRSENTARHPEPRGDPSLLGMCQEQKTSGHLNHLLRGWPPYLRSRRA
jgi:Phage integrase, N-terminal SAM-like domain